MWKGSLTEREARQYIHLEIHGSPSYLQCTERLLATIQLAGLLPKRLHDNKYDHIGSWPLLIAGRTFLQVLPPLARCVDCTAITQRNSVSQAHPLGYAPDRPCTRVLEHLTIVAHQKRRSPRPKGWPMFNTIEAVQTDVLEIGAIDLHMEAGLCRRPHCVGKGTPTKREAWC